jgi:hypothetical protein
MEYSRDPMSDCLRRDRRKQEYSRSDTAKFRAKVESFVTGYLSSKARPEQAKLLIDEFWDLVDRKQRCACNGARLFQETGCGVSFFYADGRFA